MIPHDYYHSTYHKSCTSTNLPSQRPNCLGGIVVSNSLLFTMHSSNTKCYECCCHSIQQVFFNSHKAYLISITDLIDGDQVIPKRNLVGDPGLLSHQKRFTPKLLELKLWNLPSEMNDFKKITKGLHLCGWLSRDVNGFPTEYERNDAHLRSSIGLLKVASPIRHLRAVKTSYHFCRLKACPISSANGFRMCQQ